MGVVNCPCVSESSAGLGPNSHIEVLPALVSAPVACTLGARDLPARAKAFRSVFEHLVVSTRVQTGFRWSFRNTAGLERRVRELARLEHECCPFLTFAVSVQGDQVVWATCGPAEAADVIELFYRMSDATHERLSALVCE